MTKPKPCPFCRDLELRVKPRRYCDCTLYCVECVNCGALGPMQVSHEDARKEWNRAPRRGRK